MRIMNTLHRYLVASCITLNWFAADAHAAETSTTPVNIRHMKRTVVAIPEQNPDYGKLFDEFDAGFNSGKGLAEITNEEAFLAWWQSYLMLGYIQRYRATDDAAWLAKVADQFETLLAHRDDRTGRVDTYTSTSLKGWGTTQFERCGAPWHVYIVHTGMICLAPAELLRELKQKPALAAHIKNGPLIRKALEECIADADQYWREGPGEGEGHYVDPCMGLLPMNQSNAMGMTLLEMYHVTGNQDYKSKVEKLATFFKNRLRTDDPQVFDWGYWPKDDAGQASDSEDISHAAINVEFAVRCAQANIVFTRADTERFAQTWLLKVRQGDGRWAGSVNGVAKMDYRYMPQAMGRWLPLMPELPEKLAGELYNNVESAFAGTSITQPSVALGVSHLALYGKNE